MALTKVSRGLISTSIVDNGNTTAITIDSSENVSFTGAATFSGDVGIGTDSPTAALDVKGSTSDQLRLRTADTEHYALGRNASTGFLDFYGSQASYAGYTFGGVDGERMRIDASGNLLVGKTTTAFGTAGIEARAGGTLWATASATNAASFNRLSTDGPIAYFSKDGTTVGSWQSRAGVVSTLILDPRAGGMGITGGGVRFTPTDNTGTEQDARNDIGSATYRFKDLYLSGTANASYGTFLSGVASEEIQLTLGYSAGNMWTLGRENAVTGDLLFKNSGTSEKMRLTTSGNLGIGVTNCVSSLTLGNPSADGTIDYTKGITFADTLVSTSNAWVHAAIVTTGSAGYNGNLIFATDGTGTQNNDTSGLTERMRISSAGAVTMPYQPRFLAYGASSGYVSGTFSQSVIFPTVANTSGHYSTSTGLFTAPVTGTYLFQGSIYSTTPANWAQAWLTINGARGSYTDVVSGSASIVSTTHLVDLTAGDTVGYHPYTSSGTYSIYATTNHTYFKGRLLG